MSRATRAGSESEGRRCRRTAFLVLAFVACAVACLGASLPKKSEKSVSVREAVVCVPQGASKIAEFAAAELSLHLTDALGAPVSVRRASEVPDSSGTGVHVFRVGMVPAALAPPLAEEEGRYVVTPSITTFFGDDRVDQLATADARSAALHPANRAGTLFAVYEFLEAELGFRWLAPGVGGALRVGAAEGGVRLRLGTRGWRPPARRRGLLALDTLPRTDRNGLSDPPRADLDTRSASDAEWALWLRRQRAGGDGSEGAAAVSLCLTGLPPGQARETFLRYRDSVAGGGRRGGVSLLNGVRDWTLGGLALYCLARADVYPEREFEYWENEYCLGFGEAAPDVKQYHHFWSSHYEEKLASQRPAIEVAGHGDWLRGLYRTLPTYYSLDDFRTSAAYLHQALGRKLSDDERLRLQELLLAHDHAETLFLTVEARVDTQDDPGGLELALSRTDRLVDYRRAFGRHLHLDLDRLARQEAVSGDVAGTARRELFRDAAPLQRLPLVWHFRLDPDDRGVAESWFRQSAPEWERFEPLLVDRHWDVQSPAGGAEGSALRHYDGVGWYAATFTIDTTWAEGRALFLNLDGLGDACSVYVNGELVGECREPREAGQTIATRMRIDAALKASQIHQLVVIRVRDTRGPGGLARPVWLSVARDVPSSDGND